MSIIRIYLPFLKQLKTYTNAPPGQHTSPLREEERHKNKRRREKKEEEEEFKLNFNNKTQTTF
jgi:hypothetical protein